MELKSDEISKKLFLKRGFVESSSFIGIKEVKQIKLIYDQILDDLEGSAYLRSDLSGKGQVGEEKITQIMCPSNLVKTLKKSETYKKALSHAQYFLGEDMSLDFDMLINKRPYTDTPTPLHQDGAYWIKMPDKRAASCWIAIDDTIKENGCIWFIPREKFEIEPHHASILGGALSCEISKENAVCIPLASGGATFHDGFTPHFSEGNITKSHRRALILNFRPKSMIDLERSMGIDHQGERTVRNK